MTRPLRLEFSGALYHVTSRGDRRGDIYRDDDDRIAWLAVLSETCSRYNFVVHAFCQMTNHYHLLIETIDGDLGRGMRQLNGAYSQYYNRRHRLVGHVFQGVQSYPRSEGKLSPRTRALRSLEPCSCRNRVSARAMALE